MNNDDYKKLYNELSIEWYYIEDLNKELVQKTIRLLEIYMDQTEDEEEHQTEDEEEHQTEDEEEHQTEDEEEHQTAKYIHDCLCIYLNYDFCPIELTRIIKTMQRFFNLKCLFMYLLKVPDKHTNIDKHREKERTRNLKNEILNLKNFNRETEQEIKALEHKMLGLRGVKADGVHLENATYNENRVLNIMENIEYLKQDIAHKNELIEHIKDIIKNN